MHPNIKLKYLVQFPGSEFQRKTNKTLTDNLPLLSLLPFPRWKSVKGVRKAALNIRGPLKSLTCLSRRHSLHPALHFRVCERGTSRHWLNWAWQQCTALVTQKYSSFRIPHRHTQLSYNSFFPSLPLLLLPSLPSPGKRGFVHTVHSAAKKIQYPKDLSHLVCSRHETEV